METWKWTIICIMGMRKMLGHCILFISQSSVGSVHKQTCVVWYGLFYPHNHHVGLLTLMYKTVSHLLSSFLSFHTAHISLFCLCLPNTRYNYSLPYGHVFINTSNSARYHFVRLRKKLIWGLIFFLELFNNVYFDAINVWLGNGSL